MSTSVVITVVVVLVVAGAVAWAVARARSARDGVDSFRRQIDALSPEARRTVVDQVQSAAERREQHVDTEPDDHQPGDDQPDDHEPDDHDSDDHQSDGGDDPRGT
jgi:hypothetical protein